MTTPVAAETARRDDGPDAEAGAPLPSTQRGPLAGLDDLASLLQPGGTARKFALGVLAGAAIGLAVTALRSLRRR
ncbi:MAG TPA: hypothetical protein VFS32_04535 [Candidatus Limnocylindrales bacterium]|nr:hypothetical protein [Candidatus Limnocylindrales bacterium]